MKTIITIIIISSIINAFSDVLMVSGKNTKIKKQSFIDIAKSTPDKHLLLSGIIGFFAIIMWLLVLYYLSFIKGDFGIIIMITYAMFISSILVFHVACSYTFLLTKHCNIKEYNFKRNLQFYAIPTVIFAVIYSGILIYLGFSDILKIEWWQYSTLPIFSIIIIQFILGRMIKIKYFDTISGTLGILISMLSTISIIITNFDI